MKNIHKVNDNIYITSDEEIKTGDYVVTKGNEVIQVNQSTCIFYSNKIILTTDQDLITDGVQAIDDEFLEWFVKNPSCGYIHVYNQTTVGYSYDEYHFVFPESGNKEETKQETLEEIVDKLSMEDVTKLDIFLKGVQYQKEQERMYSEEEVLLILKSYMNHFELYQNIQVLPDDFFKWFEQFKKITTKI